MPANNEFWPLVKELFQFLSNITALGFDEAARLLKAYFGKVKEWSFRFIVAIFAPLIVVVPCLAFHAKAGWLYAAYVIWAGLVGVAWFLLLVPIYWAARRLVKSSSILTEDLLHIFGLIRNFLHLVATTALFMLLFPVWKSPGAVPILFLVILCWLLLPVCSFSSFCRRIYPVVRGMQLCILAFLCVLEMIFPRHMDQLLWAIGNRTSKVLTAAISQREISGEWDKVTWFSNTGDPQVWYSESPESGYRLWAAPGFDPDTNRELKPVSDEVTRQKVVAYFEQQHRRKQQEEAAVAETRRRQKQMAAETRHKEELAAAEKARREADAKRVEEEKAAVIFKREAEAKRMAEEKAEAERQLRATREMLARYFPSPWLADHTARTDYGIIIARNAGTVDSAAETLTQAIVGACPPKTTTSRILAAFAGDGKITMILAGDRHDVATLHLKDFFKNVIAGEFSVTSTRNTSATETFSAGLRLTVKSFNPATGGEKDAVVIETKGVGFSEAAAEKMAVERAVEQISKEKLEGMLAL